MGFTVFASNAMRSETGRLVPSLLVLALGYAGVAGAAAAPPLVDAARDGDRAAIRSLLAEGAQVDAGEADGTRALHWASYRDDLEAVDLLLDAGADVNAANDLGATPLWTAGQNGSAVMVRRLLTAGADPNLTLLAGETPLMVAARSGRDGFIRGMRVVSRIWLGSSIQLCSQALSRYSVGFTG